MQGEAQEGPPGAEAEGLEGGARFGGELQDAGEEPAEASSATDGRSGGEEKISDSTVGLATNAGSLKTCFEESRSPPPPGFALRADSKTTSSADGGRGETVDFGDDGRRSAGGLIERPAPVCAAEGPSEAAAAVSVQRSPLSGRRASESLRREVQKVAVFLQALKQHAASQLKGASAAAQQMLAASVAPLLRSFSLLADRLRCDGVCRGGPAVREQFLHPFLFALSQQQLPQKQQLQLNKTQLQIQQSFMRALAAVVLSSLSEILREGLTGDGSEEERRVLQAVVQAAGNCAVQTAQHLFQSSATPTAASAAAAASLGAETFGAGFCPNSPAAEDEFVLLNSVELLSSLVTGKAGRALPESDVWRVVKCCLAVSLHPRGSALLRNVAATRTAGLVRWIFSDSSQAKAVEAGPSSLALQKKDSPLLGPGAAGGRRASAPSFSSRRSSDSGSPPEGGHSSSSAAEAVLSQSHSAGPARRLLKLLAALLTSGGSFGSKTSPLALVFAAAASSEGNIRPGEASPSGADAASSTVSTTATAEEKGEGALGAKGGLLAQLVANGVLDKDFEVFLQSHVSDGGFSFEVRALSLSLLCAALETGAEAFASNPALLGALREDVVPSLLRLNIVAAPLVLQAAALRFVSALVSSLREHLKSEVEELVLRILLRLALGGGISKSASPQAAAEAQEVALGIIADLCEDERFPLELFLNYDCCLQRSNLFEALLLVLLQLAAPFHPKARGAYRKPDFVRSDVSPSPLALADSLAPKRRPSLSDAASLSSQTAPPTGPSSAGVTLESKASSTRALHLRRGGRTGHLKSVRGAGASGAGGAVCGGPGAVSQGLAPPAEWTTDAAGVLRPCGLNAVNKAALRALIKVVAALSARCSQREGGRRSQRRESLCAPLGEALRSEEAALDGEASVLSRLLAAEEGLDFEARKHNKATVASGVAAFNASPKNALPHLEALQLLPSPASARSVAQFLKEAQCLDLRAVGLYLSGSDAWSAEVLKEFAALFDFVGKSVVASMREFLATFRLPGEAQQIERVVEAFANEYFLQQPLVSCAHNEAKAAELNAPPQPTGNKKEAESPRLAMWRWSIDEAFFLQLAAADAPIRKMPKEQRRAQLTRDLAGYSPEEPPNGYALLLHRDTVFVLSYSIVILNTDQHNAQVRNKMKKEEFVRNNRGINQGKDLPAFFLHNIYLSIRHDEIKLKDAAVVATQPKAEGGAAATVGKTENLNQNPTANAPAPPSLLEALSQGCTPLDASPSWIWLSAPTSPSLRRGVFASEKFVSLQLPRAPREGGDEGGVCRGLEGVETEAFRCFWKCGGFAVLRGVFECSLELGPMEAALGACLCLGRIARQLGFVAVANEVLVELAAYFVYSVPAHAQAVLAAVFEIVREAGGALREEGWGAFLEVLLRLHALDLLPASLMSLDDFSGIGGVPLRSLCASSRPPPFESPSNKRGGRGASRRGGGWLGDLTSILFALGDSEGESDSDDTLKAQALASSEEGGGLCDGLFVVRAGTAFSQLPSALAEEAAREEALVLPAAQTAVSEEGAAFSWRSWERRQRRTPPQREPPQELSEEAELAAASAPFKRFKTVVEKTLRVDEAVARLFCQTEAASSLSLAVVLWLHILPDFPSLPLCAVAASNGASSSDGGNGETSSSPVSSEPQRRRSSESSQSALSAATASSEKTASTPSPPPPLREPEAADGVCLLSKYLPPSKRSSVVFDASSPSAGAGAASSSSCTFSVDAAEMASSLPPVWFPLRAPGGAAVFKYREFGDRLFCLELVGALMLSEAEEAERLSAATARGASVVGENLQLRALPWLSCAVCLDLVLRRYVVSGSAQAVPTPLQVFCARAKDRPSLQPSSEEFAQACRLACTDSLEEETVRAVCAAFKSLADRRSVEAPSTLPHWELMFIERLLVTVLRLCLRLLSAASRGEEAEPQRGGSRDSAVQTVSVHLLQLVAYVHPNIFAMHTERAAQATLILVGKAAQRICSNVLLPQVVLALLQRLTPVPCFLPTVPLPPTLTQKQPPQLVALALVRGLASWMADPMALCLFLLQHRSNGVGLVQTLVALSLFVPSLGPSSASVAIDAPKEASTAGDGETRASDSASAIPQSGSEVLCEANNAAFRCLTSLLSLVGEALKTHGEEAAQQLLREREAESESCGGGAERRTLALDCLALWMSCLEGLGAVCCFAERGLRVKAWATLQQLLLSSPQATEAAGVEAALAVAGKAEASSSGARGPASPAERAVEFLSRASETVCVWPTVLRRVVFPLLSFSFPRASLLFKRAKPDAKAEALLSPAAFLLPAQKSSTRESGGASSSWLLTATYAALSNDSALIRLGADEVGLAEETLSPPTLRCLASAATARREACASQVYQRKAAGASFVCRLFLTRAELLLKPFASTDAFVVEFGDAREDMRGGVSEASEISLQEKEECSVGGLSSLLRSLLQLLELLAEEAKRAPLIYRDAFIENIKNTMLVALTCPAIAAAEVLPSAFGEEPVGESELLEKIRAKMQERREEGEEVAAPALHSASCLSVLESLSLSQRLVVYSACKVLCPDFSDVMSELILILPPTHAPPPPPEAPAVLSPSEETLQSEQRNEETFPSEQKCEETPPSEQSGEAQTALQVGRASQLDEEQ